MKKFSTVFRGYDKNEVNSTIDEIVNNYEALLNKCKSMEAENQKLKEKLDHYVKLEGTLNKAIFTAEDACEKLKSIARQESNAMIEEAKRNSNRIINDALMKAEKVEDDLETLKRNVKIFKRRLRTIVESQLQVIDEIDEVDLNKYE